MERNELEVSVPTHELALPSSERLRERVRGFLEQSESDNTKRAHKSDWRHFTVWCDAYQLSPVPASSDTITQYMAYMVECGLKPSTIGRRLATISVAHQAADYDSPTRSFAVKKVWDGLLRQINSAQKGKDPIRVQQLRKIVQTLPDNMRGMRDRALLLLGFAGAFRRSELVNILIEDIQEDEDGLIITISKSKTDQHGESQLVGIPYGSHAETCPVRAVKRWMQQSGLTSGHLFRPIRKGEIGEGALSDRGVWYIVKRQAKKTGLDPGRFGAHSLRSGLATSAAEGGAPERLIMDQTRHKSVKVVRKYIRRGTVLKDNAASFAGL